MKIIAALGGRLKNTLALVGRLKNTLALVEKTVALVIAQHEWT